MSIPYPGLMTCWTHILKHMYFLHWTLSQVEVDKASQENTSFVTQHDLFEFEKMPFGLCNAPATFQCLMESKLPGLVRKICYVPG